MVLEKKEETGLLLFPISQLTFGFIKPGKSFEKRDEIVYDIQYNFGYKPLLLKRMRFTLYEAELFYIMHRKKSFIGELARFNSSGDILAMLLLNLDVENAILDFRQKVGDTNPEKAAEGTIRKKYGITTTMNAIHAAASEDELWVQIFRCFTEEEFKNVVCNNNKKPY